MRTLFISIGLMILAASAAGMNLQTSKNPGDWKANPYSIVSDEAGISKTIRIRNLDLFAKNCHLQVARSKLVTERSDEVTGLIEGMASESSSLHLPKPFIDLDFILKSSRSIEIELPQGMHSIKRDQLLVNMGCILGLDDAELSDPKFPEGSDCRAGGPSCDHVCLAAKDNFDQCENRHLLISFERQSWKSAFDASGAHMLGKFANTSGNDLYCQILTIVKGINSITGDIVYVTAPSPLVRLPAGKAKIINWGVEKSELSNSDSIDASRPRITGICSKKVMDANFWATCHPLKRPECNWVLVK